jgi:hypothetical protein
VRGYNAGLDVTSTTDGAHTARSYHPRGMAVDLGVDPRVQPTVAAGEAQHRKTQFQRWCAERPGFFHEVFGPDNAACVKDGVVITLAEGTPLENAHDNHTHVAPRRALPVLTLPQHVRDRKLARRLWRNHRVRYGRKIIREARRAGVQLPLALALIEQESGFRNVYGHDPVKNRAPKGGRVTKVNYRGVYLPDRKAGRGMQGVGPAQLTWFALQDEADRRGGCWKPGPNMGVAFDHLQKLVHAHGERDGLRRYNGSGNKADTYASQVLDRRARWAKRL